MIWWSCLVFLLTFTAGSPAPAIGGKSTTDGRLPRDLLPYHYNLLMRPHVDVGDVPPFLFDGDVEIQLDCLVNTDVITIAAQGLTIHENTVSVGAFDNLPFPFFVGMTTNKTVDFLYLHLSGHLTAGRKYFVRLAFSGTLRKPGEDGLYYDSYKLSTGETKYIAATQFESINARQMFPCFDEVDMKATFALTVQRRPYHIALTNMPLVNSVPRPGQWIEDTFSTSPVMSTYIVCLVVGQFDFIEVVTEPDYPTPIRIYATPSQMKNLNFPLNVVFKTQKWLEETTGIKYHTPKMDHIALPSKGGAMENWGLITYGEESLTIDDRTSSIVGKQSCAAIISHELAHQWYGNLVTCRWWNDIWLNEGFATNYNYYPTEALGWDAEELQQIDARRGTQMFLVADGRNTSDPVIKDIPSAQTSESAFSGSTYPKGGAIVRMISGLMTRQSMEKAFTKHLLLHSYSNANTDQLYHALTLQADEDEITINGQKILFKELLDPWLKQMGYPLLTLTRRGTGTVDARQSRFLNPMGQNQEIESSFGYKWPIPISVVTSENTEPAWDKTPDIILYPDQDEVEITVSPNSSDWYIVNPRQMFFYRVFYDQQNRDALVQQLTKNHQIIKDQSRSQIIDDTFTLARYGSLKATEAFDTTLYLGLEEAYNPWSSALKHIMKIAGLLYYESWIGLYENYFTTRLDAQLQRLGWTFNDEENILEQYLRRDVISSSCTLGLKSCLTTAQQQFDKYIIDPDVNSVDANVLPTVLCVGVDSGSSQEWNTTWQQYLRRKTSQIREERHAYLFAMSCSNSDALLDAYFLEITKGSSINAKDLNQATQYLASTPHGGELLWSYLDDNWSSVNPSINRLTTVNTITSYWRTQNQYNRLNEFINRRTSLSYSQRNSLTQSLLDVQQNVQFFDNNSQELPLWFIRHNQPIRSEDEQDRPIRRRLISSAYNHWQMIHQSYASDLDRHLKM